MGCLMSAVGCLLCTVRSVVLVLVLELVLSLHVVWQSVICYLFAVAYTEISKGVGQVPRGDT